MRDSQGGPPGPPGGRGGTRGQKGDKGRRRRVARSSRGDVPGGPTLIEEDQSRTDSPNQSKWWEICNMAVDGPPGPPGSSGPPGPPGPRSVSSRSRPPRSRLVVLLGRRVDVQASTEPRSHGTAWGDWSTWSAGTHVAPRLTVRLDRNGTDRAAWSTWATLVPHLAAPLVMRGRQVRREKSRLRQPRPHWG